MSADASAQAASKPFGTVFGEVMASAEYDGASWSEPRMVPTDMLVLHPATHALHYGSSCFEGLKAHRQPDGSVATFRASRHAERMYDSAERLMLPPPPVALFERMVADTVAANAAMTPEPPGSLYIRPTLMGTEQNIGAAARPSNTALFYVLASPVGQYFAGGPLRLAIETKLPRTTPQFGMVKTGANYAMALGVLHQAKSTYDADQVLFAPGGYVEETGAANFLVLADRTIITPPLTEGYLHGVTRDTILTLASDLGFEVQERPLAVSELLELAAESTTEVVLSGTAAIVAPVGTLIYEGSEVAVGGAKDRTRTSEIRDRVTQLQQGLAPRPPG
ncbi:MAG: branched-chain-amino-acid transaminase, partial [Acidimicrobiia bacterium]|nr:branched-chain-amino-acid transaminase [Acidimicrobiia bacterium]